MYITDEGATPAVKDFKRTFKLMEPIICASARKLILIKTSGNQGTDVSLPGLQAGEAGEGQIAGIKGRRGIRPGDEAMDQIARDQRPARDKCASRPGSRPARDKLHRPYSQTGLAKFTQPSIRRVPSVCPPPGSGWSGE